MYSSDTGRHSEPHFHADHAERGVVLRIPDLAILAGSLEPRDLKRVRKWAERHQKQLKACWDKAAASRPFTPITHPDSDDTDN